MSRRSKFRCRGSRKSRRSFIKDAAGSEKYFFHITNAPAGIAEGDRVTFELERGTRGMNAVRIAIINK